MALSKGNQHAPELLVNRLATVVPSGDTNYDWTPATGLASGLYEIEFHVTTTLGGANATVDFRALDDDGNACSVGHRFMEPNDTSVPTIPFVLTNGTNVFQIFKVVHAGSASIPTAFPIMLSGGLRIIFDKNTAVAGQKFHLTVFAKRVQ